MARLFHEHVAPSVPNLENVNFIILPGRISLPSYQQLLEDNRDIVLWIHNNPASFLPPVDLDFFQSRRLHSKLKKVITVSNFAREVLVQQSGIDSSKVVVIHNVVEFAELKIDKFKDVALPQLIYSSDSDRGLEIALTVLHESSEDFKFNIYSSIDDAFRKTLNAEVLCDPRFNFLGRKSHEDLIEALRDAQIFLYPCTFPETFCLALGEALAAGCLCVYPNIGALKEVGMGHGLTYSLTESTDVNQHTEEFRKNVGEAFHALKSNTHLFYQQREEILAAFSLDKFKSEWFKVFFDLMKS